MLDPYPTETSGNFERYKCKKEKSSFAINALTFFFLSLQHMEFPRLGDKPELWLLATPQPQPNWI